MKNSQNLLFRNAEDMHFLSLNLKSQIFNAPGKTQFRSHVAADHHIPSQ